MQHRIEFNMGQGAEDALISDLIEQANIHEVSTNKACNTGEKRCGIQQQSKASAHRPQVLKVGASRPCKCKCKEIKVSYQLGLHLFLTLRSQTCGFNTQSCVVGSHSPLGLEKNFLFKMICMERESASASPYKIREAELCNKVIKIGIDGSKNQEVSYK